MNTIEQDAARVRAVVEKLAGPQMVWVFIDASTGERYEPRVFASQEAARAFLTEYALKRNAAEEDLKLSPDCWYDDDGEVYEIAAVFIE